MDNYKVMALRLRPYKLQDIIGQKHITSVLLSQIKAGTVGNSYLFHGYHGSGKTTMARALANSLNCVNGPTENPCGVCANCQGIIRGSSFDVVEIDGASNNGVDDMRELRENICYVPMGGKYRIVIIDEVHMLSKSAFNAMLKTIEEPPRNVVFFFATTEIDKVPKTIRSRCQQFQFRPVARTDMQKYIGSVCKDEKISIATDALESLVDCCDGSVRDCLNTLEQLRSLGREISDADVALVLNRPTSDIFDSIIGSIISGDAASALDAVAECSESGIDAHGIIRGLQYKIRDALLSKIPGNIRSKRKYVSQNIQKLASKNSGSELLYIAGILREAESMVNTITYQAFFVETMVIRMTYKERIQQVQESLK